MHRAGSGIRSDSRDRHARAPQTANCIVCLSHCNSPASPQLIQQPPCLRLPSASRHCAVLPRHTPAPSLVHRRLFFSPTSNLPSSSSHAHPNHRPYFHLQHIKSFEACTQHTYNQCPKYSLGLHEAGALPAVAGEALGREARARRTATARRPTSTQQQTKASSVSLRSNTSHSCLC